MSMHVIKALSRFVAGAVVFSSLSNPAIADDFYMLTESFPPLNMSTTGKVIAKNRGVSGLATDIVRQLLDKTGHTASFEMMASWSEALELAAKQEGYGLYSAFRTPEREDRFKWVGPLYSEDWVLLAREDQIENIDSLDDVKNRSIGSFEYDAITDYLHEQGFKPNLSKNDAVNIAKMRGGMIELWASSSLTGPYMANNFRFPVKRVLTFDQGELWLAMNKSVDDTVIAQLNAELQRMHDSGEVKEILSRYR